MRSHVVLRRCDTPSDLTLPLRQVWDALDLDHSISPGTRVTVKLNLATTDPKFLPAANTDPALVAGLCQLLQARRARVTLVESDGIRSTAEEAFEVTGITRLARALDVPLCNLSREPQVYGLHPLLEDFGLPRLLLEETDFLITLPVLKTHALTVFTGALKNQWGCIPRPDRILLHKHIHELIPILNKLFKPQLALMDGIWGMEGRGPTSGKPRYLGVLLGSRSPASLDATAMRLVGLDPLDSRHLVLSGGEELGPLEENLINVDGDFAGLQTHFEPAHLDWAVRSMNYLTRYPFFVDRVLSHPTIFGAGKGVVRLLRRVGIVR